MARGQVGASEKQLGKTNAIGAEEQKKSNQLESTLIPGYTSLMNTGFASPDEAGMDKSLMDTGYFSPEEAGAATTNEMGAAMQPFESAKFEAGNRAARTNNASDLTQQQDQLALEQGRTAGEAAGDLEKQKMAGQELGLNEKIQGQQAGMYGLGALRSEDQQAMEHMYGLGPASLGARAAGGGWTQELGGIMGAIPGLKGLPGMNKIPGLGGSGGGGNS